MVANRRFPPVYIIDWDTALGNKLMGYPGQLITQVDYPALKYCAQSEQLRVATEHDARLSLAA